MNEKGFGMVRLYILCGASGSGKTTLLNSVSNITESSVDTSYFEKGRFFPTDLGYDVVRSPKYSDRPIRIKDDEIDDVIHTKDIDRRSFDVCYSLNHVKYGIKFGEIRKILSAGKNAIIAISDIRAIRQLKDHFRDDMRTLYVSSAIDSDRLRRIQQERLGFSPTDEQKDILSAQFSRIMSAARLGWWDRVSSCVTDMERNWHAYATDSKSTEIRINRIRTTHLKYIEHISIYDHVILNYTENKPEEMKEQFLQILRHCPGPAKHMPPPVFIVAAASGAGKATLMETLNLIGGNQIQITSKLAKRPPKTGDRRDGMIALRRNDTSKEPVWPSWWNAPMIDCARSGNFPHEYDVHWEFHKQNDGTAVPYAVSSKEIDKNIERGIPQIFISNMGMFDYFKKRWPENSVFIYLYRLTSSEDNRKYQLLQYPNDLATAEARIKEREVVHSEYIQKAPLFHHVLLNTSYEEDLYDQMFNLIDFYAKLQTNQ